MSFVIKKGYQLLQHPSCWPIWYTTIREWGYQWWVLLVFLFSTWNCLWFHDIFMNIVHLLGYHDLWLGQKGKPSCIIFLDYQMVSICGERLRLYHEENILSVLLESENHLALLVSLKVSGMTNYEEWG